MKRSIVETALGAVVIALAGFFLVFSYKTAEVGTVDGYEIMADFSNIGGLRPGDDVRISGVKIGNVKSVDLSPETYLARVFINIEAGYKLPYDTAAVVSSESLLGGRYLSLKPGADADYLQAGDVIEYTQASQNLEQLLGDFIFNMKGAEDTVAQAPTLESEPAYEAAPVSASPPSAE